MRSSPLVSAAMAAFPGAELIEDDGPQAGMARRQGNWSR